MKKIFALLTLVYLLTTINTIGLAEDKIENKNILRIGVLLPLSGEFEDIGQSFLKAIQLGLYDISNKNIKIFPKDSKANALDSYNSAKEFESQGINIVIGPIFYKSRYL